MKKFKIGIRWGSKQSYSPFTTIEKPVIHLSLLSWSNLIGFTVIYIKLPIRSTVCILYVYKKSWDLRDTNIACITYDCADLI